IELYERFEKAWRVTAATSLFDYAPGTSTATFTNEAWPVENATRCDAPMPVVAPGRPQKPLGGQTAAELCGRITDKFRRNNCIHDVMVTGEKGFATAYIETETTVRNQ